ncbi:hypothetical protein LT21_05111 [Klebsiella pneumoniae]|nr:hypothetical protein LT21_05111 [Klebsiella pneumoniae]
MLLVKRIQHYIINALPLQHAKLFTDGVSAFIQLRSVDYGRLSFCLTHHQAHQIAVGHRRHGMVAHARFGQQLIGDKKIALIYRTSVYGEGR